MSKTLKAQASKLAEQGRYGDSVMVHMHPEELGLLSAMLGEPTVNPKTGLPEAFVWWIPLAAAAAGALAGGLTNGWKGAGIGALLGGGLGAGGAALLPAAGAGVAGAGAAGGTGLLSGLGGASPISALSGILPGAFSGSSAGAGGIAGALGSGAAGTGLSGLGAAGATSGLGLNSILKYGALAMPFLGMMGGNKTFEPVKTQTNYIGKKEAVPEDRRYYGKARQDGQGEIDFIRGGRLYRDNYAEGGEVQGPTTGSEILRSYVYSPNQSDIDWMYNRTPQQMNNVSSDMGAAGSGYGLDFSGIIDRYRTPEPAKASKPPAPAGVTFAPHSNQNEIGYFTGSDGYMYWDQDGGMSRVPGQENPAYGHGYIPGTVRYADGGPVQRSLPFGPSPDLQRPSAPSPNTQVPDPAGKYEQDKMMVMRALLGKHPQPDVAIRTFIETYGEKAFLEVQREVKEAILGGRQEPVGMSDSYMPQGDGGPVTGPGGPTDDAVPATIDGKAPARLSSGEYVLPADVVAQMGGGNPAQGVQQLDQMKQMMRNQQATGGILG